MATQKQIEANRKNAKRSTGPKTDSGKAASSNNSLRHGLTARGYIVLPGQEEEFARRERTLQDSIRPEGEPQHVLFDEVIRSSWNLYRAGLAETDLYLKSADQSIDPLLDEENEPKYALIQKYARQNESSCYKAMKKLGELQTDQQFRCEFHPLKDDDQDVEGTVHVLSPLCNFQKLLAEITRHRKNEAIRQNKEMMAMAHAAMAKQPPPIPAKAQPRTTPVEPPIEQPNRLLRHPKRSQFAPSPISCTPIWACRHSISFCPKPQWPIRDPSKHAIS